MGLSRRLFTKEFKLAAVRRLEEGVSIGEMARGLEMNPNVLHRWRREFRQGPGNAFPGNVSAQATCDVSGTEDQPLHADDSTRFLSRWFDWRNALVVVKPETLVRWHRKGFRLFLHWKSRPVGRPRLPKDLQALIRQMAAENTFMCSFSWSWADDESCMSTSPIIPVQTGPSSNCAKHFLAIIRFASSSTTETAFLPAIGSKGGRDGRARAADAGHSAGTLGQILADRARRNSDAQLHSSPNSRRVRRQRRDVRHDPPCQLNLRWRGVHAVAIAGTKEL
jgi:hypothetical protein